jgi:hypothetical protein
MSNFQVQKRNGGVIHAGYEFNNCVMSDCGAGRLHNRATGTEARTWVKVEGAITCKRCLKKITEKVPVPAVDEHAPKTARKVNVRANLKHSPEIKRVEKSGIDSLRDMLKLY